MNVIRLKLAALLAAFVTALAACGGGGDDSRFNSMISFGDSLSDVGSSRVGTIAAVGGGKWTVNGPNALNWTEIVAAAANVPAPCAAQTGLLPNIPGLTGAPPADVAGCRNYAQGSARVSKPFAPNALALQAPPFNQVNVGLLAVPITTQISNFLASVNGSFTGRELVTVMAGGNELFMNLAGVGSAAAGGTTAVGGAIAAGWSPQVQSAVAAGGASATNAAVAAAVAGMAEAGAELAGLVKTQIVGKGARFVIVGNLPDAGLSPFGRSLDAQTLGLLETMIGAFNNQLAAGLAGTGVLFIDVFGQSRAQAANPAQFGITNLTTPACSSTSPANPLRGSSLACTSASTVVADTSGFLYADTVHPTPLGYRLLADFVLAQMRAAGWL
jgi:outer membrane lipase/esterase